MGKKLDGSLISFTLAAGSMTDPAFRDSNSQSLKSMRAGETEESHSSRKARDVNSMMLPDGGTECALKAWDPFHSGTRGSRCGYSK